MATGTDGLPYLASLEVKYVWPTCVLTHGDIKPLRRQKLQMDLFKREHISEVRFDCSHGPIEDRRVQFISVMTSLTNGLIDGVVNTADTHVYHVGEQMVSIFGGNLDKSYVPHTLRLTWFDIGSARWP